MATSRTPAEIEKDITNIDHALITVNFADKLLEMCLFFKFIWDYIGIRDQIFTSSLCRLDTIRTKRTYIRSFIQRQIKNHSN